MTEELFPVPKSFPPPLDLARKAYEAARERYEEASLAEDEMGEPIDSQIRRDYLEAKRRLLREEEHAARS